MDSQSKEREPYLPAIKKWELIAITAEVVVLGGAVMGLLAAFLESRGLTRSISFASGFVVLGLLILPVQNLLARAYHEHDVGVCNHLITVAINGAVYALLFQLIA